MSTDLSVIHHPITDVFDSDDPQVVPLSEEHLRSFEDNGFISGIPLLSEDQVERLRDELDILMGPEQSENDLFYEYNVNESDDPNRRLFHALGAWRVSPVFHDLIFFPPMVRAAEQLLGGKVSFWHDQVFVKPAMNGAVVAWHQDYSYWTRTVPMAHLTCWIGLDDADEKNGCVHYVPGSQKWQLFPREHLAKDMNAVFAYLNAEQRAAFLPVPSIQKAGYASFHHSMTLHGSFENRSERPRRGVVINFMRYGVRSNTNDELLAGVPVIKMGQTLEGRFFPRLST